MVSHLTSLLVTWLHKDGHLVKMYIAVSQVIPPKNTEHLILLIPWFCNPLHMLLDGFILSSVCLKDP